MKLVPVLAFSFAALCLSSMAPSGASACPGAEHEAYNKQGGCGAGAGCGHGDMASWKPIGVPEVQKLVEKRASLSLIDANGAKTRETYGIIAGATLLTSAVDYDLGVLPKDKSAMLVFYCTDSKCTASGKAAERAVSAGYSNVRVMVDGIMGWWNTGLPTTTPANRPAPNDKV